MTNESKQAEAMQRVYNAKEGQIVSEEDIESIPNKEFLSGGEAVMLPLLPENRQRSYMVQPVFQRVADGWKRQYYETA